MVFTCGPAGYFDKNEFKLAMHLRARARIYFHELEAHLAS
jgi:hypothetical protein